ncbi:PEP-CTERM sorting domain-containing protein [Verrucomicrobiaceae bacterium N1E253]|uniref:PEP-CTERM sorting domain-containing protein n=1 Tax=Oceaniferula marina TaxID=2748318 RepID=A0A851GGY1_9BACT|nr:PEP-CTERM sorting domain-containing protein [Oceaniferula marina]NWK56449.1 PEP-CTERM sorting domain-containing protein [Oceaniferula marina]
MATSNKAKHNSHGLTKTLSAIGAAVITVTAATHAATVQITFTNNHVINNNVGDLMFADLTGDNIDDIVLGAVSKPPFSTNGIQRSIAGRQAVADQTFISGVGYFYGAQAAGSNSEASSRSLAQQYYLMSIPITDARINGGTPTTAWMETHASASSGNYKITITRLVFDDASTAAPSGVTANGAAFAEWVPVPEPSSTALFGLGSLALLIRRRG